MDDGCTLEQIFVPGTRWIGCVKSWSAKSKEPKKWYIHSDQVSNAMGCDAKITWRSQVPPDIDMKVTDWISFELVREVHPGYEDWGSPLAINIKPATRPPDIVLPWETTDFHGVGDDVTADAERYIGVLKKKLGAHKFFIFSQKIADQFDGCDAKITRESKAPWDLEIGDWVTFSIVNTSAGPENLDKTWGSPLCIQVQRTDRPEGMSAPWEEHGSVVPIPEDLRGGAMKRAAVYRRRAMPRDARYRQTRLKARAEQRLKATDGNAPTRVERMA